MAVIVRESVTESLTTARAQGAHTSRIVMVNTLYVPFWVCGSSAIRNITGETYKHHSWLGEHAAAAFQPSLATGGHLWFVDLLTPDPYLVLPAAIAVAALLLARIGPPTMPARVPFFVKASVMGRKVLWIGFGALLSYTATTSPAVSRVTSCDTPFAGHERVLVGHAAHDAHDPVDDAAAARQAGARNSPRALRHSTAVQGFAVQLCAGRQTTISEASG